MNFRFKNQKWPVISIRPELSSYDGAGLQSFKTDTVGAELAPDLKIVSENVFTKYKGNACKGFLSLD